MGLGFPVVVGSSSLLIGGHPDGCTPPYLVCPIQVSFKFLTFVPLILYDGSGCGHAYLCWDNYVHPVGKSEGSVSGWSSKCCSISPQDAG